MNDNMKQISKIGATYMGAVIGAAFASGQEIQQFFVVFGPYGFLGIFMAMLLFCFLGAVVLVVAEKIKAKSYYDFIDFLFGPRIRKLIDLPISLVLLTGLGIMLAGGGALFKQQLALPNSLGVFTMAILVLIILWGGIEWIFVVNLILMPIKITLTLILSINILFSRGINWAVPLIIEPKVAGNWLLASILYVSYNMLLTMVVLCTIYVPGKKKINYLGGIAGGIGLGILAFLIAAVCFSFYPNSMYFQVPMVYIASYYSTPFQYVYALVIWMAILTAAVSSGYGFAKRIEQKTGWSYRLIGVVSVIIVLPLVRLSFMDLVNSIYPIFGYFGIIVLLGLVAILFRKKRIFKK